MWARPSLMASTAISLPALRYSTENFPSAGLPMVAQSSKLSSRPVIWSLISFWSDQYEIKLQITGLLDSFDDCATIGNPADGKFSVEYRKAGKLIAVDAINDGRAHMLGRRRIAEELPGKA